MCCVDNEKPLLILGVGAGIAAYKAISLVRLAAKSGWQVQVIPTPTALEMVGRKTWEALSQRPVLVDTFTDDQGGVTHIELARQATAVLIVPATADLLARMAHGLASDLLTNVLLATTAPIWVAPAMHTQMWQHPATVANVQILKDRGINILGPTSGALSSGDQGIGRLLEPELIWQEFRAALAASAIKPAIEGTEPDPLPAELGNNQSWVGKKVLVSAGGTQEPIDPVRFLGNRSSGIFGCEIAKCLAQQGAQVTLLAANLTAGVEVDHPGITVVETSSAQKMFEQAKIFFPDCDLLVMAAAVADFTPVEFTEEKIKKTAKQDEYSIRLKKNPDILATLAAKKRRGQLIVGFAAETGPIEQVLSYGRQKAARKQADFIMVNQVGMNIGFGPVETTVYAVSNSGEESACWSGNKPQVAQEMVAFLAQKMTNQSMSVKRGPKPASTPVTGE